MDLVYLDYNGFQRSFDDPLQTRIQMEALACKAVFEMAERGEITLVWSFMHADENALCPFPDRREEALRLASVCRVRLEPHDTIRERAREIQHGSRIAAKDALHLACAEYSRATHFLTCDDRLARQAGRGSFGFDVMNPVDYVRQEPTNGEDGNQD